jgi:hypothetical protein
MPRNDHNYDFLASQALQNRVINEDDPMPAQRDAEPRVTMSGMGLTLQGDAGGFQVAIDQHLDASADEAWINETLDRMRRVYQRQRACVEIIGCRVDLMSAEKTLEVLPQTIIEYKIKRATEKAAMIAGWQHDWEAGTRRGEFSLTVSQRSNRNAFDEETARKVAEFEAMPAHLEQQISVYKKQVARQQLIIDGADKLEAMTSVETAAATADRWTGDEEAAE